MPVVWQQMRRHYYILPCIQIEFYLFLGNQSSGALPETPQSELHTLHFSSCFAQDQHMVVQGSIRQEHPQGLAEVRSIQNTVCNLDKLRLQLEPLQFFFL